MVVPPDIFIVCLPFQGCIDSEVDIAVCTIERANILVNRMLEEGTLHQISFVAIDELHMMGKAWTYLTLGSLCNFLCPSKVMIAEDICLSCYSQNSVIKRRSMPKKLENL